MRILITGSNGFIGRNMVSYFKQNTDWIIEGWEWCDELQFWPSVVQYDWVIHLGAEVHNVDDNTIFFKNLAFSKWLFAECQTHGVHLQYASSSSVYGHGRAGFTEYSEGDPMTAYAKSKYQFDQWAFTQPQYSFVQGFRYFNVYGKWMHLRGDRANIIHKWKEQARKTNTIEVWKNAEHIRRDWTWVGDICRLHLDFINSVKGSGIWNVGTGLSHSLLDIAEEVAKITSAEIKLIDPPDRDIINNICADLTHLKETVGKRKWLNIYEWLDTE